MNFKSGATPTLLWFIPSILMMSLFDFYSFDAKLPLVSLAGTVLFIVFHIFYSFSSQNFLKIERPTFIVLSFLFLLVLGSSSWSLLREGGIVPKTPIGFILGLVVLTLMMFNRSNPRYLNVLKVGLTSLCLVHVTALGLQIATSLLTGEYLDWVYLAVGEPSRFDPGGILPLPRFTGLFVEPAHCAGFLFLLCSARLLQMEFRVDALSAALMIGMIFTISILGIFSLILLLAIITVRSPSRFLLLIWFCILGSSAFFVWVNPDINEYVTRRASDPLNDPSGNARLVTGITEFLELDTVISLFGFGLGSPTIVESDFSILSGLTFLLFYFGVSGTVVFLGLLISLGFVTGMPKATIPIVFMTLLGKPPFTGSIWWFFLGQFATSEHHKDGPSGGK